LSNSSYGIAKVDYQLVVIQNNKARSVGQEIEKFVIENYPRLDLLIVGIHSQSGLKRMILGSVSEYCIQHLPCPVVVVKNPV